ncbi:MAG: hypothetical protein CMP57_04255 [Flavobacteriales bacterium]|nr:hypothetical protein [Flavobacteriales bacterium]|tara:strand:+ start:9255 stop:10745 length:1491 start_codon:yes stop_codon:yes gene_type:complete
MSVIDELRRDGDLLQAYELAHQRLSKDTSIDIVKKDLSRVLTDLLQKNCFLIKADEFFTYLDEFYALNIPLKDSVIHENILWQVGKFIKELVRVEASSSIFDRLYNTISHVKLPAQTSLFTFISSSILESQDLNKSYVRLLINIGVRNLPSNHFLALNEDGEKKASLGELMLLCIAKHITHQDKPSAEDVSILLEELSFVGENYKNIPYIDYYKAKAYQAIGDVKNAEVSILDYLKKRSKEYLAWELLADISDGKERKIQALCKTIICHTRPGQLIRSQTKLFHLFVKEKEFGAAKILYKVISSSKRELGKNISEDWKNVVNESWFKNVQRDIHLLNFCYRRANPIVSFVFNDWKAQDGIIYGLNIAKDLAQFVVSDDVHGAFKYFGDKNIKVGDFVSLKLQRVANHEGVRFKVLHNQITKKRPKRSVYKVLEDHIRVEGDKYFVGLVRINFDYAKSKGMKIGQLVRVKAVKLPSSKIRESAKWKVLYLNSVQQDL